eukprot:snap_masked-scaffold_48-processed-gene-0.12-mRNA-1 protein AED:1.00 eAED:1.00 QI:0/0/0/0/1/1/4/0/610
MTLIVLKLIFFFAFISTTLAFNRRKTEESLLERFSDGSKVVTVDLENGEYRGRSGFKNAMNEIGVAVDFVGDKQRVPLIEFGVPNKWKTPQRVSEILVKAKDNSDVLNLLAENKVVYEDSTSAWLDKKMEQLEQDDLMCEGPECASLSLEEFFSSYQQLPAIHERFDALSEANTNRTLIDSLGKSYEGRDLKMMWIGEDKEEFTTDHEKPLVFYTCTIHAREWLTPLYCTYMAEKLLDGSDDSNELLSKFTFVIAPVTNPDGYVYSYTNDIFWRKTRKPNNGTKCVGTDGNRNYGPKKHHCGEGASTDPCMEDYCGVEPFDQPETAAISAFSKSMASRIFAFNDVHSFGRYFMSPWSWTTDLPPAEDYERMKKCFFEVRETMFEVSQTFWQVGAGASVIYIAAGGADDWHYGELGVVYANTLELRGESFHPNTTEIMPSNIEAFAGMSTHLNCAYRIEFATESPDVGPTPYPTSYPTLSCRNAEYTGVTLDNETDATCEELKPYCRDYLDIVGDDSCEMYYGGIPGEKPALTEAPSIRTESETPHDGKSGKHETKKNSSNTFNTKTEILVAAGVLFMIGVLVIIKGSRKEAKNIEKEEIEPVEKREKLSL